MKKEIFNKLILKNQNHDIKIEYLKIQLDIMNKLSFKYGKKNEYYVFH